MQIQAKLSAYLTDTSIKYGLIEDPGNVKAEEIRSLAFLPAASEAPKGWVCVGIAHISVSLIDGAEMNAQRVAALQDQIDKERAESLLRVGYLQQQISKLTAITYDKEA